MDPGQEDMMRNMRAHLEKAGIKDMESLQGVIEEWEQRAPDDSEMPGFSVLAHEYGTLRVDSPQNIIDESLQTFTQCSLEALRESARKGEVLTWKKVVETFNQNPYMERDENMSADVGKTFKTPKRKRWGLSGRSGKDEEIVKDLETWLKYELVTNINIMDAMKNHVERVSNIVARTGPISYKHIHLSNSAAKNGLDFIDVGVIRYPDYNNPYIQLYRICLNAWTSCKPTALGLMQENQSGVNGQLIVRTYRPNKEAVQQRLDDARRKAVAQLSASL